MLLGSAMRAVAPSAGPALPEYFNDTFSGTNDTVPDSWVELRNFPNTVPYARQIDGRLVVRYADGTLAASSSYAGASTVVPSADVEIVFTHGGTSNNSAKVSYTGVRCFGSFSKGAPQNGYAICLKDNTATNTLTDARLVKRVNGVETNLGSFTPPANNWTAAGSNPCRFRLSAIGDQIKVRVWRSDDPEPTTWDVAVTDTSLTNPGYVYTGGAIDGQNYKVGGHFVDDFVCYAVPLPTLTQQWSSDFTGADDAVPTGWTAQISETSPNTLAHAHIDSNELLLLVDPGGSAEYASLHRAAPAADCEIVFTYGARQTAFNPLVGLRTSTFSTSAGANFGFWADGYFVRHASGGTVRKRVSHTETQIGNYHQDILVSATTAMNANPNRVRFRAHGNMLLVKVWRKDDPEPARFQTILFDSSVTATGNIVIFVSSGSATTGDAGGMRFDDFECWA